MSGKGMKQSPTPRGGYDIQVGDIVKLSLTMLQSSMYRHDPERASDHGTQSGLDRARLAETLDTCPYLVVDARESPGDAETYTRKHLVLLPLRSPSSAVDITHDDAGEVVGSVRASFARTADFGHPDRLPLRVIGRMKMTFVPV